MSLRSAGRYWTELGLGHSATDPADGGTLRVIQMGYGMLCTVVVEAWHPGAVYPVATVLLGSALLGLAAMSMAVRAERRR